MSYLTGHWAFDPFLIVAAVLAAWHEIGLARLARTAQPELTRQRRLRSLRFYGGLAVALIAVASPVGYWADQYFFVHMIQHLLLMFAAPWLVVAGAPWQPLLAGLPGRISRGAAGGRGGWTLPRALGGLVLRPWVSMIIFNVVMVAWHLPALLDLAVRNQAVGIWLMHSSFFLAGVLFWLQFVSSEPFPMRMRPAAQATALLLTNIVMWILAMALGILSSASWYSAYTHLPGVTLPAFADQQIGAGILWVCGDFWAIPTMIAVIRRLIHEDGSIGAALDKMVGRGASQSGWASRGSGSSG